MGLASFIVMGSMALSYWYGVQLIADGELNFVGVLKCGMALVLGAVGVGEVYALSGDMVGGMKAAERVYEMIDRVPGIDADDADGFQLQHVKGDGSFRNVDFTYPSRPEVCLPHSLEGRGWRIWGQRVMRTPNSVCGGSGLGGSGDWAIHLP